MLLIMFNELPETVPLKNSRRRKTFLSAAAIQVGLVALVIIVQMAMPDKLGQFQLLTTLYMAPPPPPTPAPATPEPRQVQRAVRHNPEPAPTVQTSVPQQVTPEPEVVAPTTIPKDIANIVDSGNSAAGIRGVTGGVPGGVVGGTIGGSLGGVLGGAASAPAVPPPPDTAPVRVGGNVKEPKLLHIEEPQYPPLAKKTRLEGVVVVEATVTADGTVEKVKVISGPPLLTEAATEAVSHWKYEPTYLNGQPVPVILTARITFSLKNT